MPTGITHVFIIPYGTGVMIPSHLLTVKIFHMHTVFVGLKTNNRIRVKLIFPQNAFPGNITSNKTALKNVNKIFRIS